jgi:adenylate cyclase class IV
MVVEEEELEAAKDRIASLAARLDLNQSQRLSYLELLLEGRERS